MRTVNQIQAELNPLFERRLAMQMAGKTDGEEFAGLKRQIAALQAELPAAWRREPERPITFDRESHLAQAGAFAGL